MKADLSLAHVQKLGVVWDECIQSRETFSRGLCRYEHILYHMQGEHQSQVF